MPVVTREDLHRRLKGATPDRLDPLYLLHGAEDYLRDRAAGAITEAALKDGSLREFNEATFSLGQGSAQEAIGTAEQLPMMASRRVVRVTDFARLRESEEETLLRYVARPSPTTVVIFLADELDKRRRVSKALLESCVAVEFAPLSDAELIKWARNTLQRELKAEADDRTLAQVIALTGSSVRRVINELDKLATAALPDNRITMDAVERLVGRSREHSNFELSDHLLAGNRERALATLRLLFEQGSEPLMLLGLIASHYRRLAHAKDLMAHGAPVEQVTRTLGIHFSKREQFLATARRSDARELTRAIGLIAAADLGIKTSLGGTGVSGSRLQIEMLVCELTAQAKRAAA